MQQDEIIVCVRLSVEIDESTLSDDAWLSGAVYSSNYKNRSITTSLFNIEIYTDGITVGNEYRVSRSKHPDNITINVINDNGSERSYLRTLFESKSELRQKKLEKIGI
jgi:hypothetical protein